MGKPIDLTDQRFGKLVVVGYAGRVANKKQKAWKCICDCGNIAVIQGGHLRSGHTKSCGCGKGDGGKRSLIDLTGKRFGQLLVFEYLTKRQWKCVCDCGSYHTVQGTHLRSGAITNCGCGRREDLRGQRFGKLTVVCYENKKWKCVCDCGQINHVEAGNLKNGGTQSCGCKPLVDLMGKRFVKLVVKEWLPKSVKWFCDCDCGNTVEVSTASLHSGNTKSCGCSRRDNPIGERYGKLTVIQYSHSNNRRTYYECKCDCGTIKTVLYGGLRGGSIKSCGCVVSRGENKIAQWLLNHGHKFSRQYAFKKSTIKNLRFDFAAPTPLVVEYQGEQHYRPVSFGSRKKHAKHKFLVKIILRDNRKLQFCLKHKIPLLLIPFWDLKRIPNILDDVLNGKEPTFSSPPEIVLKNSPKRQKIRDRLGITEPEVLYGLIKPEVKFIDSVLLTF